VNILARVVWVVGKLTTLLLLGTLIGSVVTAMRITDPAAVLVVVMATVSCSWVLTVHDRSR
jgi:hypothetical protein